MAPSRSKNLYKTVAATQRFGAKLPNDVDAKQRVCFVLERIVRGDERIVTVLPEIEHLHARRPVDTKFAWARMGVPVRCKTSMGDNITMWPWFDLEQSRERVELFIVTVRDGSPFWISPVLPRKLSDGNGRQVGDGHQEGAASGASPQWTLG